MSYMLFAGHGHLAYAKMLSRLASADSPAKRNIRVFREDGQVVEWPVSVLKLAFENFAWLALKFQLARRSETQWYFAKTGKWWNGIHAGLKILWPQGCEGSTPSLPILPGSIF